MLNTFSRAFVQQFSLKPIEKVTWQKCSLFSPVEQKSQFSTSRPVLTKTEVDGIQINWEKFGNGPHLLFCLPGLIGSIQSNFVPLVERMDLEKFTIIAWDPPGYGQSRPPDRSTRLNTDEFVLQVDAMLAAKLMEILGHEKYSMLGWSNGGISGAIIAGTFPERVKKLVICNSPSGYSKSLRVLSKDMVKLDTWSPSQREAVLKVYDFEYAEKMLKGFKAYNDQVGDPMYKKVLSSLMPKVRCPTMFVHGQYDLVAPRSDVKDYSKWIRHMKVHVVAKGVHDHLAFADELVKVSQDFLLKD